jgi:vancomycin resistance protein YoaR
LAATALLSERVRLREHVMPGVLLDGGSVAGYSRHALEERVQSRAIALSDQVVRVAVADAILPVSGFEFGVNVDTAALVDSLLQQGRSGSWFAQLVWRVRRFAVPVEVTTSVTLDAVRVDELAKGLERALLVEPREAKLEFRDGALRRVEPQPGQVIDRSAALERLQAALEARKTTAVELPLDAVQPATSTAVLDRVEADARQLLLAPIAVAVEVPVDLVSAISDDAPEERDAPGSAPVRLILQPKTLGPAVHSRTESGVASTLMLALDSAVLAELLTSLRERFERPAVDARFEVDKRGKVTILPGKVQTRLDLDAAEAAILAAGRSPERRATLQVMAGDAPRISTELAHTLNIRGLVSQFTTGHPCCRPRVQNIHRIAELLDGVVVLPGETFSVNQHVGQRGPGRGFVAAPTIVHGEMSDTYGGGISQFATTLFNAVLLGGYGVIERQAHSYYFPRYPLGHEATLSFPKPDLIFQNDTKSGLLIDTEYGATFIRVKIYGDNEGRVVRTATSPRFDYVDPELEYEVDDTLQPEEAKVRKRGSKGFSVEVSRTIATREGNSATERRKVVYNPRVRVVAVHSCKIPEGELGHTGLDCPEPELSDAGVPPNE